MARKLPMYKAISEAIAQEMERGELPPYGWGFVRVHYCFTLTGRFTPPLPPTLPELRVTLHQP